MFTYIYIYLTLYILTYIFFFNYFIIILNLTCIQDKSMSYLFNILRFYTNINPIYMLFFFLSGLPPVGFFIIKFNILLLIYSYINFTAQILIFLNFLLAMFFYLQIFNSLNWNINKEVDLTFLKTNKILQTSKYSSTFKVYKFTKNLVIFFIINFFFIFFYIDVFLIFNNFL